MSDNNDIIQRRIEPTLDAPSGQVVDSGARQPKQDLWDTDDDIFKPLLDRIQAEQAADNAKNPGWQTREQDNPFYHADPLGLVTRGDEPPQPRRRSVVEGQHQQTQHNQGPVTIRSDAQTMPRVVWGQSQAYGKKLVKFFDDLNNRTQLLLSGVALFMIWNAIALFSGRLLSLALFQFDPFFPRNWEMIFRLYEQGSTLPWPFVLYYAVLAVVIPIFGLMVAVSAAPEFRKTMQKLFSPFKWITRFCKKLLGFGPKSRMQPVIGQPHYSNGGHKKAYHGATFKKSGGEDDTTGGSIGGGSGGGHGKPSWQSGPANTQAFPRGEQGRR